MSHIATATALLCILPALTVSLLSIRYDFLCEALGVMQSFMLPLFSKGLWSRERC